MKEIKVTLGDRSYPICVGRDVLTELPERFRRSALPEQLAVVTDTFLAGVHLPPLSRALRAAGHRVTEIVLRRGEHQKSLASANRIITRLLEEKFSRRSGLVAFGGGVVGDVTGFVAATFRRGIAIAQVPTTLLSQVESSIGGKTAVNHALSKNAIGAYHQPALVFSDIAYLATLPKRERICGLGEIIKYGMLDQRIYAYLDRHVEEILAGDLESLYEIVVRCNAVKAKLVRDDEREEWQTGGRAVLNLGHTVGHALEDLSRYRLRHGEAVVLGLRWELEIARAARLIEKGDAALLDGLLRRIPFHPPIGYIDRERLIEKITRQGSSGGFVMPKKIGKVFITRNIPASIIRNVSKAFTA